MKIEIHFRLPMRRWQARLMEMLRADGHDVWGACASGRKETRVGVALLLAVQRRLAGPSPSLFDAIPPPIEADRADSNLVICLDGTSGGIAGSLEPLFDGRPGEAALIGMLARAGAPTVRICLHEVAGATTVVGGVLAIEDRDSLARALDQVLARLLTLMVQAVRRLGRDVPPPMDRVVDRTGSPRPLAHMVAGLARKVRARSTRAAKGPPHWRIGFRRRVTGDDTKRGGPASSFDLIPDDGTRFYADPMAFEHAGRRFIFFEDFPYAASKGAIARVEIGPDGAAGAPHMVLEQLCHLSYPFVLRHRGAIYMLPEMSAAGRVQLFRADPFPDRWVADRILVEDCVASDATPIWHQDRWWLFATLSDDAGSTWDALGLFHAPDLLGPWTPHVDNPVLVDAGAARPAGAMWHENGVLMRIAQDCREGYGLGLAVCRVDRLDEHGYAQTVRERLAPPFAAEVEGIHTLNRSESLEVIDLRYPHADRVTLRSRSAAPHAPGRD